MADRQALGYVRPVQHLSVPLPADLQRWVEHRVAEGRYLDAAEYVRALLRRDQDDEAAVGDQEDVEMRALVAEGEASGYLDEDPKEVLRRIMSRPVAAHG
jgi:antitoxin ParD1/3/4